MAKIRKNRGQTGSFKRVMNIKVLNLILALLTILYLGNTASADFSGFNGLTLDEQDVYEISFGSIIEGYVGQEGLLIPIRLVNEQPVEYVHLKIGYDASIIDPVVVAPALFYQYFSANTNIQGVIDIEFECDLIPPPSIPPIPAGDAVIAYILADVVVGNLGRDVYTALSFSEDPNTPFPDNFLMLDSGWFIVPPALSLTPGTVYIYNPVYGDINLNGYVYEIGDIIMFVSYLSGYIDFNARQMANSDCNRDRIQASISDLVYMLNVINGRPDTLSLDVPGNSGLEALTSAIRQYQAKPTISPNDSDYLLSVSGKSETPIAGFTLTLKTSNSVSDLGEIAVGHDVDGFYLASSAKDNIVKIVACSLDLQDLNSGNLELLRIPIGSTGQLSSYDFEIVNCDFSDEFGRKIDVQPELILEKTGSVTGFSEDEEKPLSLDPLAYPNPFNSQVMISYNVSQPSNVSVEIFDILGRKVQTLKDIYEQTGRKQIIWDSRNSSGDKVSAGLYLCRIKQDSGEKILKLQYLK